MRILIVGAGIAGLVAARALRRRLPRASVQVVEREADFAPAGAGIVLGANAMAVLDALGLRDGVRQAGQVLAGMRLVDRAGRTLQRLDVQGVARGTPTVALHRAALHRVLREGLEVEGVEVEGGRAVAALEVLPQGARVRLQDGEERACDLLLGADGLRSTVRQALPGPAVGLRYSGQTCWRFVAPDDSARTEAIEAWGPGRRIGLVPIGPPTRPQVYGFLVEPAPPGSPAHPTDRAALWARFQGFCGGVDDRLATLPPDLPLLHHDLFELDRHHWGQGRVVLLGDAAHAMTPNLGQGAGMGIEDAWVLAELLATEGLGPDPAARLAQARGARVRFVADSSRRIGQAAHWSSPVARGLRDLLMVSTPAWASRGQQERLLQGGPVPLGGAAPAS